MYICGTRTPIFRYVRRKFYTDILCVNFKHLSMGNINDGAGAASQLRLRLFQKGDTAPALQH
jgi:hypothetical protein